MVRNASVATPEGRAASSTRNKGLALGVLGLVAVSITLVSSFIAASFVGDGSRDQDLVTLAAWGFGIAVTGFALAKLGIAAVLSSVLVAVKDRAAAAARAVPALMRHPGVRVPLPEVTGTTPFGRANATVASPPSLLIHRVAAVMWKPALAMGAMAIVAGLSLSLFQADAEGSTAVTLSAWTQGTLFLGEGLLLSGISFLLGTILGVLRAGGGRVQEDAGVTVTTLALPTTAKLFLGFMMAGLMIEVGQFIAYAIVATSAAPESVAGTFALLGPIREAGLGLLLAGIVLALATIAKVLGFQFWRLEQIVTGSH